MKRIATALLVLAATAPAAAGGGGCLNDEAVPPVTTTVVEVEHACWAPVAALVAPGTTVTFRNPDKGNEHNLSGPTIPLDMLPPGATRRVTFDKAGLYPFMCSIHPGMAGVVVVGDVPAVAPTAAADAAGVAGQPAPGGSGPSSDGGGSLVPWAVAGALVAVVGAGAFAWRARGVPVPAR